VILADRRLVGTRADRPVCWERLIRDEERPGVNAPNQTLETTADPLSVFATPEFQRDPYPYLRELRESAPVCPTAAGFHLLTRHADVELVTRLSGDLVRSPDPERLAEQYPWAAAHRSMEFRLDHMLMKDPPGHTRLRRVIARDFTPRRVGEMAARIGEIVSELADGIGVALGDGETVDLHQAFSKQLSVRVISELLGVPEQDRPWMAEKVGTFTEVFAGTDPSLLAKADEYVLELETYFTDLLNERRRTPQSDLLSALAQVNDADQDRLTDRELMSMVLLLWIAGFETTAAGIDHGVLTLLAFPDQADVLLGDDAARLGYVDEVLRRSGPAVFSPIPRFVTREVTLSGVTLPAGSQIRPVFAAANRDPEVFADPDRFDPARETGATLAFSHGLHHCLGSFLARTEMSVALNQLHQRFPGLELAGEPEWTPAPPMHAPTSLPVALSGR
jgi:cytochrome P450